MQSDKTTIELLQDVSDILLESFTFKIVDKLNKIFNELTKKTEALRDVLIKLDIVV